MSYGDTEVSSVLTFVAGVPKEMELLKGFTKTQITVKGQSTGKMAIRVMPYQGDLFEQTDPPLEMDLSVSGTALLTGAIDAIELTSDFDGQVTVVALLQLET